MKHMHVAAALIIKDRTVFAAQRNGRGELAYRWEFPGGKLEPGESAEQALVREITEELSVDILIDRYLMTVEHAYRTFSLTMDAYLCFISEGEPMLSEHLDGRWLSPEHLFSVDWAEADVPIVHALKAFWEQ